jgi:hypothetical protein
MENLVILWGKVLDAQCKLATAQAYSDWADSVRAFKAAETRASKRYFKAVEEYLSDDHTMQDRINLTTQVQAMAAAQ